MSKKKDIVDLVQGSDGSYTIPAEKQKVVRSTYPVPKQQPKKQNKQNDNVAQFLSGMDVGLDFMEGLSKRVDRILKLKTK